MCSKVTDFLTDDDFIKDAYKRQIVNLLHGIIRAESPEGQGAVFIVELLLDKDHYRPSEVCLLYTSEYINKKHYE